MSEYNPPIENVPIFNSDLFVKDGGSLDIATADKRYLKFPFAQGTETFQSLKISNFTFITSDTTLTASQSGGVIYTTFSNSNLSITLPDASANTGVFYKICWNCPGQYLAGASLNKLFINTYNQTTQKLFPFNKGQVYLCHYGSIELVCLNANWYVYGGNYGSQLTGDVCVGTPNGASGENNYLQFWTTGNSAQSWQLYGNGSLDDGLYRNVGGSRKPIFLQCINQSYGKFILGRSWQADGTNYSEFDTFEMNALTGQMIFRSPTIVPYTTTATLNVSTATPTWSGGLDFNTVIPSCSVTYPTTPSSTSLITKGYGDSAYTSLTANNVFTGTNEFQNSVSITGTGHNLTMDSTTGYASFHKLRLTGYQSLSANATLIFGYSGHLLRLTGGTIYTLPDLLTGTNGIVYYFLNSSSSPITIITTSPSLIAPYAANSFVLAPNNTASIVSQGTSWFMSENPYNYNTLLSTGNTWASVNSFSNIPVCSASYASPSSTSLITKGYADTTYATKNSAGLIFNPPTDGYTTPWYYYDSSGGTQTMGLQGTTTWDSGTNSFRIVSNTTNATGTVYFNVSSFDYTRDFICTVNCNLGTQQGGLKGEGSYIGFGCASVPTATNGNATFNQSGIKGLWAIIDTYNAGGGAYVKFLNNGNQIGATRVVPIGITGSGYFVPLTISVRTLGSTRYITASVNGTQLNTAGFNNVDWIGGNYLIYGAWAGGVYTDNFYFRDINLSYQ